MKTLTFSKKSFHSTLFTELIAAFRKPPVNLKIVSKAACDSENYSKSRRQHVDCNVQCTLEISTNEREENSETGILIRLSEQSFELVSEQDTC
jgi:hypothetical protein